MYELKFDEKVCSSCETLGCLMRCQYMEFDLESARRERDKVIRGEDSVVLRDCATCYACEEYCPYGNHPFYLIVERQEQREAWPVPLPLVKQQVTMMEPRGDTYPQKVQAPLINMCYFPMLLGNIQGRLFEGASTILGSDLFCNIMWLHFAKGSVIKERLPGVIENIWEKYMKNNGVEELICFHDECYGTYTHLAPAFGIDVPWKSVHLFEFLVKKLDELKDQIKPLGYKVAYQRPCSNRLIPETQPLVNEIFSRIGVDRVEREYDRDNALCCGGVLRAAQRQDDADDVQNRNIDDMLAVGANICVFNCPACFFTMGQQVAEKGLMPMFMSDLCRAALGEL